MSQLDIHPDLQNLRAFALPSNPLLLSFMNRALDLVVRIKNLAFGNLLSRKVIIGLDGHRIPVWLVEPENLASPSPALLYFHGGAFIMKHAPQHIKNAIRYACEANCRVIFVDYRLAPFHPFPAPFDDCYNALLWTFQNAEKLGIDKQRIAVGGDSAGGALAASAAQKAARENGIQLCGQLLLYPAADGNGNLPSSVLYTDVAPMKRFSTQRMWRDYLGRFFGKEMPAYASPLHGDLAGLAPAYIETTEFDPLHDESMAYARALMLNGNDVALNETRRTVHGYDLLAPNSAPAKAGMEKRIQFLRRIFNAGPA